MGSKGYTDPETMYRQYIDCLNNRSLDGLTAFVAGSLTYNDSAITLEDYQGLLRQNFHDIPDLCFNISLLVANNGHIAARLKFDCTPTGEFMGIAVKGKRVVFHENVFYHLKEGLIDAVWSVIDLESIRKQL